MDSMKGERVIITGPTSGVGKEATIQVAEVVLACRDVKMRKKVASEIARPMDSAKVVVLQVDTSRSNLDVSQQIFHVPRLDLL